MNNTFSPHVSTGKIHVFPASDPTGTGSVLRRMRVVATMSLSATGSKKAPKAEEAFCMGNHELSNLLSTFTNNHKK